MTVAINSRFAMLLTLLVGCAFAGMSRSAGDEEQSVWFWFTECKAGNLALEVKLDGTLLQAYTIPICQAHRDSPEGQGESRSISFPLEPSRKMKWSRSRTDQRTTKAGRRLDVNIWQAGADPSDILLGVSVSDSDSVYINTIHIAYPEKPNTTLIADGLVVSTHPVSAPH